MVIAKRLIIMSLLVIETVWSRLSCDSHVSLGVVIGVSSFAGMKLSFSLCDDQ